MLFDLTEVLTDLNCASNMIERHVGGEKILNKSTF
jgi:hypothetical protein